MVWLEARQHHRPRRYHELARHGDVSRVVGAVVGNAGNAPFQHPHRSRKVRDGERLTKDRSKETTMTSETKPAPSRRGCPGRGASSVPCRHWACLWTAR